MNEILNSNIDKFNSSGDSDYFIRRDHQLRGEIVVDLLNDVINKESKYSLRLLSIACSTGVIEEKIKDKFGITVFGVDAAKDSIQTAKKRGIMVSYADVSRSLPFEDSCFDFVFAGEIIEHVFDTRSFLTEINRVTKPKGCLILTTPNLARFDDRLKLLFGKTPRQISPLHPYLDLHIRPFTFDLLKKALEVYGFSETFLRTNVFTIDFFGKDITLYFKFFTSLFPTLGSILIVRARKS